MILQKVWLIGVTKDAAHVLRKEIKPCTCGLDIKHFYAFDLQDVWINSKIKESSEIFLAALFSLNRIAINIDNSNKKEIELDDMIPDSDDEFDDTDDGATDNP